MQSGHEINEECDVYINNFQKQKCDCMYEYT